MQFLDKNIAVFGLGVEALDLIPWLFQQHQNLSLTIFDRKSSTELASTIKKLKHFKSLRYSLGENSLKSDLTAFDIIFRSPGFPRLHPRILQAEKAGVQITSLTQLFFQLCPCPIIGVTGTKGKGTTASLITQILRTSGLTIHLAGNIGQPPLKLLDKLKSDDFVCLELSSFQLQDLKQSPHLAVVLNITSEHLDVHQNLQEYRQAKTNIVTHQTSKDLAVINADYPVSKSFASKTKARVFYFSRRQPVNGSYVQNNLLYLRPPFNQSKKPQLIGSTKDLLLRGQHNWENITAAVIASALAGASLKAIKQAVFSFKGLEHRLELVRSLKDISFYNDSFSTTPETAIAALQSFHEPTIIILGGSDKGSDYSQLAKTIVKQKNLKAIILIGQMADNIQAAIDQAGGFKGQTIRRLKTMPQIVNSAYQLAQSGDVVILSPACASFDMFKNYKHRGQQFKQTVLKLK